MSDDLVKRLREIQGQAGLFASAAADRIEELEAKLAKAGRTAMAEALIAIQQHTSDDWVKNLRLPHLLRMVGLLRGGKDE